MQRLVGLRARVLVGGPSLRAYGARREKAPAWPGRDSDRASNAHGRGRLRALHGSGGLLARVTMADVPCWQKLGDARSDSGALELRRRPRRESGGGGPGGLRITRRVRVVRSGRRLVAVVWQLSGRDARPPLALLHVVSQGSHAQPLSGLGTQAQIFKFMGRGKLSDKLPLSSQHHTRLWFG
jgi:hypothetical protein